jgi:AcrR family transcriptional regulator
LRALSALERTFETIVRNEGMTETTDTKTRLLDVAEELFADQGLDRVSVRDITHAAHAHLSAVNYHFGSKEELIAAVFERRIATLNAARLAALDEAEQAAGGEPLAVEKILEAFVRPTLRCCQEGPGNGTAFSKLLGRCLAEPRAEIEALLKRLFDPLIARMEAALMKALPSVPRSEIFWRMKFTFGALHHLLLTRERFIPAWAETIDTESQMQKLIAYAAAGFKAPVIP